MKDIRGATSYTAAHLLSVCRSAPVLSVLSFRVFFLTCCLCYSHRSETNSQWEELFVVFFFFFFNEIKLCILYQHTCKLVACKKAFKYFEKKLILLCAQTVTFNKMIFTRVYLQRKSATTTTTKILSFICALRPQPVAEGPWLGCGRWAK